MVFYINKLKKNYVYYVSSIILGCLVILVLILFSFFYFLKNKEHLSVENLINLQILRKNIYSSPFHIDYTNYSIIKYSKLKPDVLIIGTSTGQHISDNFSGKKVLKLNNNFYNLEMSEIFLKKIIKIHKPKIILYSLDWWVLNSNWTKKNNYVSLNYKNNNVKKNKSILSFSSSEYFSFYKWIILKKINYKNIFLEKKHIGILANENFEGFTSWGNYLPSRILIGSKDVNIDIKFQKSIERLKNKIWNFESFEIDNEAIKNLENIKNILHENQINFIKFYPPISPYFFKILEKERIDFIESNNKVVEGLDILNLRSAEYYNDCMFLDALHSGETLMTYLVAKILLNEEIITNEDFEGIEKLFKNNILRAYFPNSIYPLKEIDFLKIGCDK